jgi:hypothetical protein
LLRDEGLVGALRLLKNAIRDGAARRRMLQMRGVFRRYRDHLAAIMLVAVKAPPKPGRGFGESERNERSP